MRSPLGFKILLVLILGLVSSHPIRALNEDPSTKDALVNPVYVIDSSSSNGEPATQGVPGDEQASVDQQQSPIGQEQQPPQYDQPPQASGDSGESEMQQGDQQQQQAPQEQQQLQVDPKLEPQPQEQPAQAQEQPQYEQQSQAKRNMDESGKVEAPSDSVSSSSRDMSGTPRYIEGNISPPVNEPQNTQAIKDNGETPSTARGFGSDLMSSIMPALNPNGQNQQQQQQPEVQRQELPPPRIIENDRSEAPQVSPQIQQLQPQQPMRQINNPQQPIIAQSNTQPKQQQTQQQQQQQQQQQLQQQQPKQQQPQQSRQQQQQPNVQTGQALVLPGNSSVGSMARTFESWTGCVGASSSKYGTCKNDVECNKSKGRADGSCMGGFGVCCVMALTCGDKSIENNTFFANPDFPEPSWEARLCEVEVKKKHSKILQVMIEFEEFELAPPNHEGECTTDVFQVKLSSARPSPYSLLRICGQNTGQHLYLDVSQIEEPLVLSVATSGGGFPRRWSIRIVQMDEKNFLLAPPGCLQYYTDTVGHFRSFNLGKNLKNLYYAICFRIDNGYSGIRFTENFFGMNGPFCRKRIAGGQNKTGMEAHPHHLVIPPPGYGPPPPRPHMRYPQPIYGGGQPPRGPPMPPPPSYQPQMMQQQQPRFKRMAYLEPDSAERVTRTFHPIEKEEKKFEEKEVKQNPYPYPPSYGPGYGSSYQSSYGPPPSYGPPSSYGPPPPSYSYHHEYNYHPEYKKLDKFDKKWEGSDHESKGWGWMWGSKDAKQSIKDEKKSDHGHSHYGYGDSYSHQGYGSPGYSSPAYGEYHHKEIDKFGKKYEVLEYKHEKNHKDKDKDSAWWKVWGKKEEKKDEKKEKFDQHHEAMFPMIHIPEMPHCEPRFCGQNDVITFPPSGDSISEMCGNRFNRGHGPKIISGSPLVVYVSNRGHNRGAGFDMNYEQVFYIPKPY